MIYNDDLLIGINVTIIMIKQSANIGSQIADDKDVYSLRFILEATSVNSVILEERVVQEFR